MKNHLLYFTIKVNKKNPTKPQTIRPYTDRSFINIDKAFSRRNNGLSPKCPGPWNLHNRRKTN